MKAIELLFDGNRGQYIPRDFVEECNLDYENWQGLPNDVLKLKRGPTWESYWDVWTDVLDGAEWHEDGNVWRLYQDGDVWLVCDELMTPQEYLDFYGEEK